MVNETIYLVCFLIESFEILFTVDLISVRHIPSRHTCYRCGRHYLHRPTLKRHLMYECGKEPSFGCQFCKRIFKRKDALHAHVLVKHYSKNQMRMN